MPAVAIFRNERAKWADGKSAFAGNLGKPDPAMHVLMKKF